MNSSHLLEMMEVVDNLTVEVSLPPPSQTTAAIVIKGTTKVVILIKGLRM